MRTAIYIFKRATMVLIQMQDIGRCVLQVVMQEEFQTIRLLSMKMGQ